MIRWMSESMMMEPRVSVRGSLVDDLDVHNHHDLVLVVHSLRGFVLDDHNLHDLVVLVVHNLHGFVLRDVHDGDVGVG